MVKDLKMNKEESDCVSAGGVWIDGQCSMIVKATMTLTRGNPCHGADRTIELKNLDPLLQRALADAARKTWR